MFNTVIILTDFEDFYNIQMIGKILSITQTNQTNQEYQKNLQIHTLKVRNYSITEASFLISQVFKFFENAIFVCVVDPEVGTKRRAVIIKKSKNLFIGPDNGIFSMLTHIDKVVEIDEDKFNATKTFHGRDIFAVIAGEILNGKDIAEFGKTDASRKIKMSDLKNKVLYTDNFGNIITSIRNESVNFKVGEEVKLKIKGREISARFVETFADEKEKFIIYCGSSGFIEIGKFMDNASKILNVEVGDKIEI